MLVSTTLLISFVAFIPAPTDAWHEEHLASLDPSFSLSQMVTVSGAGQMVWPCCAVTETQAFFSVCNSGFQGHYALEFNRGGRAEDRWDTLFTVHTLQSVVLTGAEEATLPGAPPPLWGHGFHVKDGGSLELTNLRTDGGLTLDPEAIGLVLRQVTVLYPVSLLGGVVAISDSRITTASQPLELAPRSLAISGSEVLGRPNYHNATSALSAS